MLGYYLEQVRKKKPVIHTITNYVTANDVANMLLASGAKPVMANAPEEAEEITAGCDGLCLNMGTPNRVVFEAMKLAGEKAASLGHPIVLDPVGIGASSFRRNAWKDFSEAFQVSAVRGNVSEIRRLLENRSGERGVDASPGDSLQGDITVQADFARKAAKKLQAIVAISGEVDLISDGERCCCVENGRGEMSSVTGTGCQLSGLCAAFLAAVPFEQRYEAMVAAVAAMGVCGEIGWERMGEHPGNASFRNAMIDAMFCLDAEVLETMGKVKIL